MRHSLVAVFLTVAALSAHGQTIHTVAGGGVGDGQAATQAVVSGVGYVALDAAGNLYLADQSYRRVRRVDAQTNVITTVAGNGNDAFSGDGGPATQAALGAVYALAVDPATGTVFLGDLLNGVIRRVDGATGVITRYAGTGTTSCAEAAGEGGLATAAALCGPKSLALDAAGNLYFSDSGVGRVRRIDKATGVLTTVAGGGAGNGESGPATGAELGPVAGVAFDSAGDLYVAGFFSVHKVSMTTGAISRVAGTGTPGGSGSIGDGGPATSAIFSQPFGIAFDAGDNLYIADSQNHRVRRVDHGSGLISTVLGGDAATAQLLPISVAFDAAGRLYVADGGTARVLRFAAGVVETFAGNGSAFVADGLPGTTASIAPRFLGLDGAGNVYFADASNRVGRLDSATGLIHVVAGTGESPAVYSGDGGDARLAGMSVGGLAVSQAGDVFIADTAARRLRKVDHASGIISTIGGTGAAGSSGDNGDALLAAMTPSRVALDGAGNLYLIDIATVPATLRKVSLDTNIVTTLSAQGPIALAADPAGAVYVSYDSPAHVERIENSGIATTVFSSSPPLSELAVDGAGNLFFHRTGSARIEMYAPVMGQSFFVAGTGQPFRAPFGDGGPPLDASLHYDIQGLAFGNGGLYIADTGHGRVRKANFGGFLTAPGSIAFDGRLPQTTSLARHVTFVNLAGSAVAINSITVSGPFAYTTDCGATAAAGASCGADVTFAASAVGPFTGSLVMDTASGPVTVPLSGAGELSLVTHFYETILRRPPDTSGKPFWDGERTRVTGLGASVNESWFAMSSSFYASSEYLAFNRDSTGFLTDLYKSFFNRAPDAGGLQFWVDQIANGMPREVVLASFQHSPEFASFTQGLFGNVSARAEVNLVMDFYRGLLARLPDSSGFAYWVGQFRTAQCSGASAVTAQAQTMSELFATSGEYVAKNRTNAQYTGDLYNAFLRRGGELQGVRAWIDELNAGTLTRPQMRGDFRASQEFTDRVNAVVAQGCVN